MRRQLGAKNTHRPVRSALDESTRDKRLGKGETFRGLDCYGHTKQKLYARAHRLDIRGRSRMSKKELASALDRKE